VALTAPALYGQFLNLESVDTVLNGLLKIGFDDVFDVAYAAEMVSNYTRRLLQEDKLKRPVISSTCPAVIRLIRARFPSLCDHILPVVAPVHIAAKMARDLAVKKTGLPPEKIGIFYISSCAAKVTDIKNPIGIEKSDVDHVLSIRDIFIPLLKGMKNLPGGLQKLGKSGLIGIGWAASGGEGAALLKEKYFATDGIDHVVQVLEQLEDGKFLSGTFIELKACTCGCVGGALAVENPFVAMARIHQVCRDLPFTHALTPEDADYEAYMNWTSPLEVPETHTRGEGMAFALQEVVRIEELKKQLPGLDCGACGAPTCAILAKDIVRGSAALTDCVFMSKQSSSQPDPENESEEKNDK